jgi:SagB-type dehydrogenase family enzyme
VNLWTDSTTTVRLWSLSDEAMVEDGVEEGSVTVVSRWGEVTVTGVGAAATETLRRMRFGPVSLRNALPSAGAAEMEGVRTLLDRLGGAVVHSLGLPDGSRPLLSLEPVVPDPVFRPVRLAAGRALRLSRFATIRPADGGALLLEVPGAAFRARLGQPIAQAVVAAMAGPATVETLAAAARLAPQVVEDVVSLLVAGGAALVARADGTYPEDSDPVLAGWAHHELLFHQQSRGGRGVPVDGGGPPREMPPVARPRPPGRRLPLHRPGPAEIAAADPTLDGLLETDHVCPRVSGAALTAEQVGTLLYRAARIRSTGEAYVPAAGLAAGYDASQRPYLNTACLYELELYLTLNRCTGLPPGIYHYDPLEHALTLLDAGPERIGAMLDVGRAGAGTAERPAALVTITARMERLSWVLNGSSYATALKHCGVLQGALYLVGKAMGLAAHAIPAELGGLVDALPGVDWPAEVEVGECVLDPGSGVQGP